MAGKKKKKRKKRRRKPPSLDRAIEIELHKRELRDDAMRLLVTRWLAWQTAAADVAALSKRQDKSDAIEKRVDEALATRGIVRMPKVTLKGGDDNAD